MVITRQECQHFISYKKIKTKYLVSITIIKTYNKETGDTEEETKDPVDEIIRIGMKKPIVLKLFLIFY